MKRWFKTLLIMINLIFNIWSQVLAGDSIGFTASCIIPAIPGVNAPLNEENKVKPAASEEKQTQTSSFASEPQQEDPVYIEEIREIQLAQEAGPVLTKLIYSR